MAGRFSISAIFSGKDYLSTVMKRIQGNFAAGAKGIQANIKAISQGNDKLFSSLNGVAKKATLAAAALGGVSAVGAALDIGKTASEFEQAITNVGAVSLMTRDQIGDLEFKALDLARTTKFTATEVANAMELMGKAGFNNRQIIEGIDGVLAASAAEGLSIEETASHVSNVLKGMGLDGDDMGKNAVRVADVLTLASARTNSSISSLGEAMANVSATARQLNVPLEQTVAAVAMLQDVGIDASTAGSAVNTMLTQMATPSKSAAAEMKKWGISFKDAHGNMLPFQEVLAQLSKAAKKAGGNFDQVAFFADLVGLRGQKAAANLKDLFNSGKYQDLARELDHAAGSAKKMADIRLNTLEGDVTLFKSSLDLVKIAAFKVAGEGLRPIVQNATNWLNVNKDLIASKSAEYLHKFGAALPTIGHWLGKFGTFIGTVYALSTAIKVLTLVSTMNPWVAALYAALTALGLIVAFWPEIKAFGEKHKAAIEGIATAIGLWVIAANAAKVATLATATAQSAAAIASIAYSAKVYIVTAAQQLYAVATGGAALANSAFAASLLATLGPIAAVAAAVGALIALYSQLNSLSSETEGLGITGIISEMVKQGTWDPFKAVDNYQNERARNRATDAGADASADVISPQERAARYYSETNTNTNAELTIKDDSGRAFFSKPPKGKNIKLAPSGAM